MLSGDKGEGVRVWYFLGFSKRQWRTGLDSLTALLLLLSSIWTWWDLTVHVVAVGEGGGAILVAIHCMKVLSM